MAPFGTAWSLQGPCLPCPPWGPSASSLSTWPALAPLQPRLDMASAPPLLCLGAQPGPRPKPNLACPDTSEA